MMELEPNPDYYRGKPRIQRVVLKFAATELLTELLSGNVDVIHTNRMDLLKLAGDPRFEAYDYTHGLVMAIVWNQRHPLFRDSRVRRALTLAINRRELHQVLNLPESTPVFDVLSTPDQFSRRELPMPLPYDPEQAKHLLEQAGWRDGNANGVRKREGKTFRFTLVASAGRGWMGLPSKVAVYIQAQLRRVGIQMDITSLESLVQSQRVKTGDFEAAISIIFPAGLVGQLAFFTENPLMGYTNPKFVALLQQAGETMSPDDINRIYRELWPIFQADLPMTLLCPFASTTVVHRRIRGLSGPYWADPVSHMEELWLED